MTDVGDGFDGVQFDMLRSDSSHWESQQHNDSVTNIVKLSPSQSHQHNVITHIILAFMLDHEIVY